MIAVASLTVFPRSPPPPLMALWGFPPRWLSGKEFACQCRRLRRLGFDPWVGKIPWSRKWQPIPVFSPAKFLEQRNLVGLQSREGVTESDMSEHTCMHPHISLYSLFSIQWPGSMPDFVTPHLSISIHLASPWPANPTRSV